MPNKPKKPCRYPGCPNLTSGQYCDKHAYLQAEKNHRYYKEERDAESQAFYNSKEWLEAKNEYLLRQPLCERCKCDGKLVYATIVHHKIPIREGGARLDLGNFEALCEACHNRHHAQDRFRKKVYTYRTRGEKNLWR